MKEAFELIGRRTEWPSGGDLEITGVKHWEKGHAERIYIEFQVDGSLKAAPSGFIRVRGNANGTGLKTEFGELFFQLDGCKNGAAKKAAITSLFQ